MLVLSPQCIIELRPAGMRPARRSPLAPAAGGPLFRRGILRADMAATLKDIETRLLGVMPVEPIDRHSHALAIASVVFESRRQAARNRQAKIAVTREQSEMTREFTRLLKDRMHQSRA